MSYLILLLLFHLFLLFNLKFTLWPEMVVYPYLVNKGFLLYRDIINPYPPLLTLFLAPIHNIFGYGPIVSKVISWFFILFIDLTIFYLAKIIYKNNFAAIISLIFWFLLSPYLEVNGLWFEQVMIPFLILGVVFLVKSFQNKKRDFFLLAGTFLAICFGIKQTAILITLVCAIAIFVKTKNIRSVFKFIMPTVILTLVFLIYFYSLVTLKEFINWVLIVPLTVMSKTEGFVQVPTTGQFLRTLPILLLGLPALFSKKPYLVLIMILGFFSFAFAIPRFEIFHLLPSLAFFAILIPAAFEFVKKNTPLFIVWFFIFGLTLGFVVKIYQRDWQEETRFFESVIINKSNELKTLLGDQKVYVQNGPDQLLVLANLTPIKPWAIQFPWYLEKGDLQKRTIAGLASEKPAIIYQPYSNNGKYALGAYRPELIANFINDNYETKDLISKKLMILEPK